MKTIKITFCMAAVIAILGACSISKQPHDPIDENIRYMYFTAYPDNCRLKVNVKFKDDTPEFNDERITKEQEPINYSVDVRKFKSVTVTVEKYGWVTQTRTWENEPPFDVFIKLEEKIEPRKPKKQ